jgi:hypothetical protein
METTKQKRTMSQTVRDSLLAEVNGLALVDLDAWSAEWNPSDLSEVASFLDAVAVHLARKAAYFYTRSTNIGRDGSKIGDHGHKKAVETQNKRAEKVRKAIGYLLAKDDITF